MEEKALKKIIQDTAKDTAERMREFHQEDIKVLKESMDVRFETMEQRMNERFDGVESALQMLLTEFKQHREQVEALEKEVEELRSRVQILEQKLAAA